jgi:hypothetical protein
MLYFYIMEYIQNIFKIYNSIVSIRTEAISFTVVSITMQRMQHQLLFDIQAWLQLII